MREGLEAVNREYTARFAAYALVLGEGDPGARVLLAGEAPGAREAELGRPFVGAAGKKLDAFLALAGLRREEVYITNAVKFRPARQGASGRLCNRPPTREEAALFAPWLLREIAAIGPRVVVTLGNTPLRAVMGSSLTIGQTHGRALYTPDGQAVFPLYHPASILYRPALLEVYEADVRALADWLK